MSEASVGILPFLGLAVVGVGLGLVARYQDRRRIGDQVAADGGKLVDISWDPFGGARGLTHYEVTWLDRDGTVRVSDCMTAIWAGVYFKDKGPESWPMTRPGRPGRRGPP